MQSFKLEREVARSYVCSTCGFHGHVELKKPSAALGVFLLLLYIIPGLIYFAWRETAGKRKCPMCQGEQLIPDDSPMAQKILSDLASR